MHSKIAVARFKNRSPSNLSKPVVDIPFPGVECADEHASPIERIVPTSLSGLSDVDLAYRLRDFVNISRAVLERFMEDNGHDGPLIRIIESIPRMLDHTMEMTEEMIDRAETAEHAAR